MYNKDFKHHVISTSLVMMIKSLELQSIFNYKYYIEISSKTFKEIKKKLGNNYFIYLRNKIRLTFA